MKLKSLWKKVIGWIYVSEVKSVIFSVFREKEDSKKLITFGNNLLSLSLTLRLNSLPRALVPSCAPRSLLNAVSPLTRLF